MLKKNYYKRREDDMKVLIAEAKARNNLDNKGLAKKIGVSHSSISHKTCHPGNFSCSQLWLLEELAGKEAPHEKVL